MLVLSRKKDEKVYIGDDVQIKVIEIRGDDTKGYKVRLGIIAPPEVPVHTKEVYDAIKREKEASRKASESGLEKGAQQQ